MTYEPLPPKPSALEDAAAVMAALAIFVIVIVFYVVAK